ncbi:MAG: hypothetical protein GX130_07430 [Candidatus Hydrogenedens sp.]|nr:hypothetical protein [Candidatus Hydrogenedens sp.]
MRLLTLLFAFLLTFNALAADFTVLPDDADQPPRDEMVYRYLLEEANSCLAARKERYESVKTVEDVERWQNDLREKILESLGGFPERCPLNARIVEKGEREHFRFEKIIFQSQPGLFVTALLYLPRTEGPWPGIIVPCGHSANGKAAEPYQRASMLLAANGLAALCYDPIGQGERYTFLKDDGSVEIKSTTIDHTLVGTKAILTGINTATFRIWDGMRAIDYLQSRDDIIKDKIGCTGNSGGGTLTSYLMALDERIVCAAPSCYITTFERLVNTIGPQDAEQNFFGQIAFGMEQTDYIHLHAPNPVLLCTATKDFFDIGGSWSSFREAKRLFTRLGHAERVDLIENDAEHGFHQAQREGAARWMSRWLLKEDRYITEPEFQIFTDEEALCSSRGQVIFEPGARSVLDLLADREKALEEKRMAYQKSSEDAERRSKIRELINLPAGANDQPEVEFVKKEAFKGGTLHYMIFQPEEGIVLPALMAMPASFTGAWTLICVAEGKASFFRNDAVVDPLLEGGNALLALDLRGLGETVNLKKSHGWDSTVGPNWADYFLAYLLGRSYVGMRTGDILAVANWLQSRENKAIHLIATGEATVPARHAAALEPDLFEKLRIEKGIDSWAAVVHTPRARHQLINTVHNALAWYDLPDLTALTQAQVEEVECAVPVF